MSYKIENRIEKLESELLKYKKTTLIALVFSIICGGGGLVGLATWITSMPKENQQVAKIQVETAKLELGIIQDSLDISIKKFNELTSKHNTEVESITRQLELFKSMGSTDQVKVLTNILIDKEQQFQALIMATAEMCQALSARTSENQEWFAPYMETMEAIKQESFESQRELEKLE